MLKRRKSFGLKKVFLTFMAMLLVCCSSMPSVVLATNPPGGADITAIATGNPFPYSNLGSGYSSSGDTWYSCWSANNNVDLTYDDGTGLNGSSYVGHGLSSLSGDLNSSPPVVTGSNLNPGSLGSNMPNSPENPLPYGHYSANIYEVDGVLYQARHNSEQGSAVGINGPWDVMNFWGSSLYRSTDGGANWYNVNGQLNTLMPAIPRGGNINQAMFPSWKWGFPNFVQYGEGGVAPNIDNAQNYVYLISEDCSGSGVYNIERCIVGDNMYLCRIPRTQLLNNFSNIKSYITYYNTTTILIKINWTLIISYCIIVLRVW